MRESVPLSVNLKKMRAISPSMAYDGKENFYAWQARAQSMLRSLLGLPYEKCEPLFEIEFDRDCGDFFETRFSFQSEEGYFVPCHFLSPKQGDEPHPLMICIQGHSKGMHISLGRAKFEGDVQSIEGGDRDYAINAIKHGFCAVTLEQRCMGECGGTPSPDCFHNAMAALLTGRTLIGERVWDISRLIDVIELNFPQADRSRIYCMGNSGGGTATFYATCLEERIKGAIPSCALCTYEESIGDMRHCACNYIPHIREYFNMGDLCGLIVPRPLVIVSGEHDNIFPIEGARKTYETAKKLYEAAGAGDKCVHTVGEEGHRFYAEKAWQDFDKIRKDDKK